MKFQLNPIESDILRSLPATIFAYSYSSSDGVATFSSLNEGLVPLLAPGQTNEAANQVFAFLNPEQTNKLKQSLATAGAGEQWSCNFLIDVSGRKQWIAISGKHLSAHEGQIEGSGFATLAGDQILELEKSREKLASLNQLHDLIINFSTLLVQARLEEVDQAVNITLSRLGEYAEVDRVYIFEYDPVADVVNNTYEWCSPGTSPEIDNLQGVPFEAVPRWKEKFSRNEYVYIPLVSEIAPEYHVEKEILEPQGIISLLALPLYYGERLYGFIGFDSVKRQREWSVEHINLLRLAGEIIAGTINRAHFERSIVAARKEAEEANKAKSEFLATMSHEIRTPMNAILGFSEILSNSINSPKEKQYIDAILTSGRTLLALINDILDLSKIESGQMHIIEEPVDLLRLTDEIVQLFQPKVAEKNIYLHIEKPAEFPKALLTDEVRIRQVLFNIIGNAVKFTLEGGVMISLNATRTNEGSFYDVEIKVRDTGIGIPPEKLEHIFQSFYQVESDVTRKFGGTGLGLAISQKLMQLLGGKISVKSEQGRGSTFTVELKGLEETEFAELAADQHDWSEENVEFDHALVLLVDDVDYNRELVKKYLENYHIDLLQAVNGKQGVEICHQYKPQLVLMDLRMPEMNGYEATEALKKDPATAHIPVIAFTASSMKHDEDKIRELFDGYVRKPVTRNEIVRVLKKFLPYRTLSEPVMASDVALPDLEAGQVGLFLKAFYEALHPLLEELRTFIEPDAAEQFVRDLAFYARQYNISHMVERSEQLKQALESFDFGQFDKLLGIIAGEIAMMTEQSNH
ncbi:MAG: response regulator [Bacteroidetes bacterium]|nr:response regulator [Bacteroidota bacterium]